MSSSSMTDPRLADLRAALVHLEGVESALERAKAVGGEDDVRASVIGAEVFTGWIRTGLERQARLLDPVAADPLVRRADEPRTVAGS